MHVIRCSSFLTFCCLATLRFTWSAGPEDFFTEVKEGEVDLVILMDRSLTIERLSFYTNEKVLIHDIIMYHLPVHTERLRLAILTFAVDVDVIVDGISGQNEPISKCDVLDEDHRQYWNDVQYKLRYTTLPNGVNVLDYGFNNETNVNGAFSRARGILQSGKARRSGAKQYVLIATAAGWSAQQNPQQARDDLLNDDIQIYVIGTGPGVETKLNKLQTLQTDANAANVQLDSVWREHVWSQQKLIEVLENADWVGSSDGRCPHGTMYCETITSIASCDIVPITGCTTNRCQNGGSCYFGNFTFQCVCPPGYSGRYCEDDVDECLPQDLCYPGSVCLDRINSFECVCDGCNDTYCDCHSPPPPQPQETSSDDDDDDDASLVWLYVLIPLLLILLLILLVCFFVYYRRKRQEICETQISSTMKNGTKRAEDNYYEGAGGAKKNIDVAVIGKGPYEKDDDLYSEKEDRYSDLYEKV